MESICYSPYYTAVLLGPCSIAAAGAAAELLCRRRACFFLNRAQLKMAFGEGLRAGEPQKDTVLQMAARGAARLMEVAVH
jgi:hypothetical protein